MSGFKTLLTGFQPSGILHLGNYLSVVRQLAANGPTSSKEKRFVFIADLHSFTHNPPSGIQKNCDQLAASLIASGVKQENTHIFTQSNVVGHSELAWILSCLCSVKRLSHLPQWKERLKKEENQNVGSFCYPILQAADILLYRPDYVPIGNDQITHLELTRDIVRKFSSVYPKSKNVFVMPEPLILDDTKIMSLVNAKNKMSKSDSSPNATIFINDSNDAIQKKLKGAQTDSIKKISYDPIERPGLSNLIRIFSLTEEKSIDQILTEYGKKDKVEFKECLADVLIGHLTPIRDQYTSLMNDLEANGVQSNVRSVLANGRKHASVVADQTMKKVKSAIY